MTIFESNMGLQPSLDFGDSIGFFKNMPDTFDLSDITRDMVDEPTVGMDTRTGHWINYDIKADLPEYRTKDGGIIVRGFGINRMEPYAMVVLPDSISQRSKYFGGGYNNNIILPKWMKYDAKRVIRDYEMGVGHDAV